MSLEARFIFYFEDYKAKTPHALVGAGGSTMNRTKMFQQTIYLNHKRNRDMMMKYFSCHKKKKKIFSV